MSAKLWWSWQIWHLTHVEIRMKLIVSVHAWPPRHSMMIIHHFILIIHFIMIFNNVLFILNIFNSTDDFHMYCWQHDFYFISIICDQILKQSLTIICSRIITSALESWIQQHRLIQWWCWTQSIKAGSSLIRIKLWCPKLFFPWIRINPPAHGKNTLVQRMMEIITIHLAQGYRQHHAHCKRDPRISIHGWCQWWHQIRCGDQMERSSFLHQHRWTSTFQHHLRDHLRPMDHLASTWDQLSVTSSETSLISSSWDAPTSMRW